MYWHYIWPRDPLYCISSFCKISLLAYLKTRSFMCLPCYTALLSSFNSSPILVISYCFIIAFIVYSWSCKWCKNWQDVIISLLGGLDMIFSHTKWLHCHWLCYYCHLGWAYAAHQLCGKIAQRFVSSKEKAICKG